MFDGPERRTGDDADTGHRRRDEDYGLEAKVDTAISESRVWRAKTETRLEEGDRRMTRIEQRIDMLVGAAGKAVNAEPGGRMERYLGIIIPIIVASLPVIGTIVAAWLALKGQLAQSPP